MSNNIITAEERETIFNNMCRLLDEYDYTYTDTALYKIIDTWAEQKADLIALFKKHPNYVEGKFMIAFNSNWCREIDKLGSCKFCTWINNNILNIQYNFSDEVREIRKNEAQYIIRRNPEFYNNLYKLTIGTDFLYYNYDVFARQFVNKTCADLFNKISPSLHFSEGMKMSRAINKICHWLGIDKLPEYNKEFAKYADSVNPLKIMRHTIISINPIDYLTMSFGNSWASCHTIDKENRRGMPDTYEGQYSSGTISYMLDEVSMVFYTISAEYDGDDYFFEPKINRNMFHYGEDKLIQGRLYPQGNDYNAEDTYKDIREIVQKVMADCLGIPNYWVVKKGADEADRYVKSKGTHYKDYQYYDNCTLSRPKGIEDNDKYITVGHNPICIECGYEHNIEDNINCCHFQGYYCEECGEEIDEDDVIWIDENPYCRNCVSWCECCQEYVREDDAQWVKSVNGYVCNSCLDEYFIQCDYCGEYVRQIDANPIGNGDYICEDCFADNYSICSECGAYFPNDELHWKENGEGVCDGCWEEVNENKEKKEKN